MFSKYKLDSFDIEIIANMGRAFTNNPDLMDDETFDKLIQLL